MHVGEPKITAGVARRELLVVEADLVQDRGMKFAHGSSEWITASSCASAGLSEATALAAIRVMASGHATPGTARVRISFTAVIRYRHYRRRAVNAALCLFRL